MPSNSKIQKVSDLIDKLNTAPNFVLIDFLTATHKKLEELRKKLREDKSNQDLISFSAVKNSLFKIAMKRSKKIDLIKDPAFKGQTAMLTLPKDWSLGLKTVYAYIKNENILKFKFGQLDGNVYPEADLMKLAELPSKNELVAKLLMSLKTPQTRLVRSLNYNMSKLIYILKNKGN